VAADLNGFLEGRTTQREVVIDLEFTHLDQTDHPRLLDARVSLNTSHELNWTELQRTGGLRIPT